MACHDNATFLAERYAASCPRSLDAIYLLAYCHYRSGCPRSARGILVNRWPGRNDLSSSLTSSSSDSDVDNDDDRTSSAAVYLLAKSCYDLGLYGEAEEALLGRCRYACSRATTTSTYSQGGSGVSATVPPPYAGRGGSGGGEGNVVDDGEHYRGGGVGEGQKGGGDDAMDEWIVRSSRRCSSVPPTPRCPVPNGAAGMYLLGNICRRTNRRRRAIEYYRLSLRIDPLMWTSYEAMCEIGGGGGAMARARAGTMAVVRRRG